MTAVVRDDAAGRQRAVDILESGGVVAIPTDTVYGISVALATAGGVERLFRIKDRPVDKAIMVLADGLDQVADLVRVTPAADALAVLWPGGLTLVLPLSDGARLPAALTAGTTTLGVRVPDHAAPRHLARAVGPIPTTSANRSGATDARSASQVVEMLGDRVDMVLDGGHSPGGVPSTVVDCSADRPRILRAGAIAAGRVAEILAGAGIDHDIEVDAAP